VIGSASFMFSCLSIHSFNYFFMKLYPIFSVSTLILCVAGFVAGCSKEEPAPPVTTQVTPPPAPATDTAQKTIENTAADVKAKADTAATEVTKTVDAVKLPEPLTPPTVTATPPAAQSSVQGIIQRVQSLVAEQKYPEALSALSELSSASLTAEQQNLVTQLKTQISNAMAAKAGSDGLKSVGGLLKK
jgi:outer membrane PBP1 activator LpoA protein